MNDILRGLNPQQKQAVIKTEGPVMVIAGAGSGKTKVLTNRIAYLIEERDVDPYNILAITFTNKAANEMNERVRRLIGDKANTMWISTFHSMGARILRTDITRLGYQRGFSIIDDDDTLKIVKQLMKDCNYDPKYYNPKMVKNYCLTLKNDEDSLRSIPSPFDDVVSVIYEMYQAYLFKNNLVDFQDLLVLPLRLFKECPDVLNKYQMRFRYILVDEFQDTNNIQFELIQMLGIRHQNVFVVGDQDQSIYAFRGANIQNIMKFENTFTNCEVILLEQNYRSTDVILDAANSVIQNNQKRKDKKLWTENTDGKQILFNKSLTGKDEARFVAEKIRELYSKGYSYDDFAILYRANSSSRLFEDGLLYYGIPYKLFGNVSFLKRKEVKDIIAYLRLIVNENDDFAFERVVNEPKRGIGKVTLGKVKALAMEKNCSYMEVIPMMDGYFSKAVCAKFRKFKMLLEELRQDITKYELTDYLDYVFEKTNYLQMLKDEGMDGQTRLDNIYELKTMILEKLYINEEDHFEQLIEFLEDVALRNEYDESDDTESVKLMTIHASKGLEFRVVFLVNFEQGMFPSSRCMESLLELEEERRLAYVAITRAKELLVLSNAKSRTLYGSIIQGIDSMFIEEINDSLLEKVGYFDYVKKSRSNYVIKEKTLMKESSVPAYKTGSKVNHKLFGEGIVVSVDGETMKVAFSQQVGIKKLMMAHPALSLVK